MKYSQTKVIFIILLQLLWVSICAQEDSTQIDEFSEKLENYKSKNKFNRFIHRLLVKKPKTKKGVRTTKANDDSEINYAQFEGKYIRNIQVKTYDPFGYSLTNSEQQPEKFIEKSGNFLHIKTKKFVIRNYILPKEGENIDSLKIIESKRLIRSQRFTRKVQVQFIPVSEDSVDILFKTLDAWTFVPNLVYSGNRIGFKVRDRNFFGIGHEVNTKYKKNIKTGNYEYSGAYKIPNIKRTFINFHMGYHKSEDDDVEKEIALEREFFSPLTRWAGGAYIGQKSYKDSIPNNENITAQNFKYTLQDYWAGYSFRLFKKYNTNTERFNNLILSARYFNISYQQKPIQELDKVNYYSDEEFYLMGIGFSRRGYVQDRFIKNYDLIEDIPVGLSYGIVAGLQNKKSKNRFYLSGEVKIGNYYKIGYFGLDLKYGGFITNNSVEQSVFSLEANYYTRVLNWGKWKFRNFVTSQLIIGNKRVNSRGDRLTLNENDPSGIEGFHSLGVIGTKKWLTDIQIQSYSPYEVLGFRFSPFLNSSLGLIGNEGENIFKSKLYTKIGIGIMFTNDYFVFSNFQISLAWFNCIPGDGNNLFKTNALDFGEYEPIEFDFGKPETIRYNPDIVY